MKAKRFGGVVEVFNLEGHQKAIHCYAWSHGLDNSKKRRFFAVLHQGPVDSPEKVVKAVIVGEFRKEKLDNVKKHQSY